MYLDQLRKIFPFFSGTFGGSRQTGIKLLVIFIGHHEDLPGTQQPFRAVMQLRD